MNYHSIVKRKDFLMRIFSPKVAFDSVGTTGLTNRKVTPVIYTVVGPLSRIKGNFPC